MRTEPGAALPEKTDDALKAAPAGRRTAVIYVRGRKVDHAAEIARCIDHIAREKIELVGTYTDDPKAPSTTRRRRLGSAGLISIPDGIADALNHMLKDVNALVMTVETCKLLHRLERLEIMEILEQLGAEMIIQPSREA